MSEVLLKLKTGWLKLALNLEATFKLLDALTRDGRANHALCLWGREKGVGGKLRSIST